MQTFALRFGFFRWLMVLLLMGPRRSRIVVGGDAVDVRMGWGFRAVVPRSAIVAARRDRDMRWGIGVHGWRGRWLVNGATTGIVTLDIEPRARAWVAGVPIRLRTLHVSLEDPAGFVTAMGGPSG